LTGGTRRRATGREEVRLSLREAGALGGASQCAPPLRRTPESEVAPEGERPEGEGEEGHQRYHRDMGTRCRSPVDLCGVRVREDEHEEDQRRAFDRHPCVTIP